MPDSPAREPADLLITHGLILTIDRADTTLRDGAIAVRGAEIIDVGPTKRLLDAYQPTEVIDATGQLVMPGLINTHTHSPAVLYRGLIEDLPLEAWLEKLWVSERQFVTPEYVRLGAALAQAEMLRGGTTTAVDMYWHPEELAQAALESGFRLVAGPVYFDGDAPDRQDTDSREASGREFLQQYRHHPTIIPCVMPHSTYTVSPKSLGRARDLAERFGALLSTHCAETATEVRTVSERHRYSPQGLLDELGMLDERTILAHCVHTSGSEIEQLAEKHVTVSHCPLSNLKLGSGVAPIPAMQKAGVRVTVGTDGAQSSNDLDMWTALRVNATLHKGVHQDPTLITAREALRMATVDAAEAIGLGGRLGSLEAGKLADVVILDLRRPHLTPLYDVYAHLAFAAGRDDVHTVIVHGKVVVRGRDMLTLRENDIMAEVNVLARDIQQSQR